MDPTYKKKANLQNWVTFTNMDQTYKNGSHLHKRVTVTKKGLDFQQEDKLTNMGHTLKKRSL